MRIKQFVEFETGKMCRITGGHNLSRFGAVIHWHRHTGLFDIVHVEAS